jgi:2-methylisocitrate lyase-like PEP mutase family enzyme
VTAEAFRALHHQNRPLVLPNVWDAASARVFADAGFPALATSSSAVATTLGYADEEGTPAEEMFAAIARIVRAVDAPVSADVEAGYGLAAHELVERLLSAGAVGCNLEDSRPSTGSLVAVEVQADWLEDVCGNAHGELVVTPGSMSSCGELEMSTTRSRGVGATGRRGWTASTRSLLRAT